MKKILLFRHEPWIEAPHLTSLLFELNIPYEVIKIDEADKIPNDISNDTAALVFLGGTMSVNDSLAWIEDELKLIRLADQKNIPILGHCLGSQLISKALGGTIAPMKEKEIGWHSIQFCENQQAKDWQGNIPNQTEVMLWHHDEFTIPEGASSLYTSKNCKNQAFVKGNILATVAHIELSTTMLQNWLEVYGNDIQANGGSVQAISQIQESLPEKMQKMHFLTDRFYLKWLESVYHEDTDFQINQEIKSYLKLGSCLCGDITFHLKNPRDVVNCHCQECRKFHGNYAAFTKVEHQNIYIFNEEKISWYQIKPNQAKRGFCKNCGSSLFWKSSNDDGICVSASVLNVPTKLRTTKNIYTDNASDFYNIDNSLENYSSTMNNVNPTQNY